MEISVKIVFILTIFYSVISASLIIYSFLSKKLHVHERLNKITPTLIFLFVILWVVIVVANLFNPDPFGN